jgi:hypothetical protein
MGVGYQVSALHRLVRLETRELDTRSVERGENPVLDAISDASGRDVRVAKGPLRTRSPTIDSVVAWRQRIASKYREQLDEELTWNERSAMDRSPACWMRSPRFVLGSLQRTRRSSRPSSRTNRRAALRPLGGLRLRFCVSRPLRRTDTSRFGLQASQ